MGIKVAGAMLVVMVGMALYGVWQKTQYELVIATQANEIQTLQIEKDAALADASAAKEAKKLLEGQVERGREELGRMQTQRDESRALADRMRSTFQDHDFADLLEKKPGLIERRMIDASADVFREMEDVTSTPD